MAYVRPVSTIQFQQVVVPEGVIDLGVGQPNNAILPVDYVRRAAEMQFNDSPEFLQYGAEWGDGYHRVALGEFLTDAYGVPVTPSNCSPPTATRRHWRCCARC